MEASTVNIDPLTVGAMNSLQERIAEAFGKKPGAKKTALAKACGVSSGAVTQWFTGQVQTLKAFTAISAASYLGVEPLWLTEGRGPMRRDNAQQPQPSEPGLEFVQVDCVSLKVSAGITGFQVEHHERNGPPIFFRADWMSLKGYRADKLFALRVSGDSMEPNLWDGDLVVFNSVDATPRDGDVFVVNYEGEVVIKRLSRDAGEWWLTSDNPRHKPKRCDEYAEIIGRVIYKQSERI